MSFGKSLSTPPDYDRAVVEAVTRLAAAGGGEVSEIAHGTTVATNAVLEHSGAETGMLTTEGIRGVVHIGRH